MTAQSQFNLNQRSLVPESLAALLWNIGASDLQTNEIGAYLTRGHGFSFQQQGLASSGWVGFQAALSTVPDLIVAHHLAEKHIERYVKYITRLIPQAEPIQAWVSTTFSQVHTPRQLRAWASQFEDQLRIHARRRVESWRKRQGSGFKQVPTIARLQESPSGIAAIGFRVAEVIGSEG